MHFSTLQFINFLQVAFHYAVFSNRRNSTEFGSHFPYKVNSEFKFYTLRNHILKIFIIILFSSGPLGVRTKIDRFDFLGNNASPVNQNKLVGQLYHITLRL